MQDNDMTCAICQADMTFEVPPDEGVDDCTELICTGCGNSVITTTLTGRVWWRPRGAKIAPRQRRAA